MRKLGKEIQDIKVIELIIKKVRVCRLAMLDDYRLYISYR